MTDVKNQRRLAGEILKRGKNAIWMDHELPQKISQAITREDVAKLIRDGAIKAKQKQGTSRARARALKKRRARGQRRGPGSRKGTRNARLNAKTAWINKIRAQRKYLRKLRDEEYITPHTYRMLYRQAKGNLFRSVRYLSNWIMEHNLAEKRLPELKK